MDLIFKKNMILDLMTRMEVLYPFFFFRDILSADLIFTLGGIIVMINTLTLPSMNSHIRINEIFLHGILCVFVSSLTFPFAYLFGSLVSWIAPFSLYWFLPGILLVSLRIIAIVLDVILVKSKLLEERPREQGERGQAERCDKTSK
jgi:hypothetical protein